MTETPNVVGLFKHNSPDAIETYSGRAFPVLKPLAELVVIEDIAHALANICRFGGHTRRFYSVAEHCCHVRDLVAGWGYSRCAVQASLLHDAHEAYMGDCVRPLKHSPIMEEYRIAGNRVQEIIWEAFKTRPGTCSIAFWITLASIIKRADDQMVRTEAEQLMSSRGREWAWGDTEAAITPVHCWSPDIAKAEFLERYERNRNA